MKLGVFQVDCTPPEGYPIGFGMDGSSASIRDPLYMRGFVLNEEHTRCLVASLDYCGLMNSAHDGMARALAGAVGISPTDVVVHCVHQHDTPLPNFEMADLVGQKAFPKTWWQEACARCGSAAVNTMI